MATPSTTTKRKPKKRKRAFRTYSEADIDLLKQVYLDDLLPLQDCAEALDRPIAGLQKKIADLGWAEARKAALVARKESNKAQSKGREMAEMHSAEKGKALVKAFVASTSLRAAQATSTAFDSFDRAAKAGELDDMEKAIKIADRASNIARKAMGLDSPHAGAAGGWNPYYQDGDQPRKVEPVGDDAIDV